MIRINHIRLAPFVWLAYYVRDDFTIDCRLGLTPSGAEYRLFCAATNGEA